MRLVPKSHTLWAEFTAFQHMAKHRMIDEHDRALAPAQLRTWLINVMADMDFRSQTMPLRHTFPSPPREWLTDFTPKLNQATLLATAVPPVTLDMSTVSPNQSYRYPLQWAALTQYRDNVAVVMKPLPIPHPLTNIQLPEY